jgi:hypothetical protein
VLLRVSSVSCRRTRAPGGCGSRRTDAVGGGGGGGGGGIALTPVGTDESTAVAPDTDDIPALIVEAASVDGRPGSGVGAMSGDCAPGARSGDAASANGSVYVLPPGVWATAAEAGAAYAV